MFAHSLSDAEKRHPGFHARRPAYGRPNLDVLCRDEIDAADAALELTRVTGVLRQMIAARIRIPTRPT